MRIHSATAGKWTNYWLNQLANQVNDSRGETAASIIYSVKQKVTLLFPLFEHFLSQLYSIQRDFIGRSKNDCAPGRQDTYMFSHRGRGESLPSLYRRMAKEGRSSNWILTFNQAHRVGVGQVKGRGRIVHTTRSQYTGVHDEGFFPLTQRGAVNSLCT